jgi:hypothetical protein
MHRNERAPNTWVPGSEDISGDFDVEALLAKGGEVLKREFKNIMRESANGKLSPGSARDLVNYLRLLSELKIEESQAANALSEEELKAIASPKK